MATSHESTAPDIYGQVHPIESPELIQSKLAELDGHVDKIEAAKKQAYLDAVAKGALQPHWKLLCLRCEQFNAQLAALRLVNYWQKRLEIFGPERAYLPLTLTSGALDEHDIAALRHGFVRYVADMKDPAGRAIIFGDPSRQEANKDNRIRTVRALWYVMHAALQDETAQKVGVVMISDPRQAKFAQFDSKLDQLVLASIRGCLPVRIAAFHLCHMPSFFSIIFPIVKVFLGKKLRQRINLHQGSVEHVLDRMQVYGLTRDKIPEQLGGTYKLDREKWVADRLAKGL